MAPHSDNSRQAIDAVMTKWEIVTEDATVKHILMPYILYTLSKLLHHSHVMLGQQTQLPHLSTQSNPHGNYTNSRPPQESQKELSQHEYPDRGNESS